VYINLKAPDTSHRTKAIQEKDRVYVVADAVQPACRLGIWERDRRDQARLRRPLAETPVGAKASGIQAFTTHFPASDLVDLRHRIAATSWPEHETVVDDSQGV
jgi:hypothetical protein